MSWPAPLGTPADLEGDLVTALSAHADLAGVDVATEMGEYVKGDLRVLVTVTGAVPLDAARRRHAVSLQAIAEDKETAFTLASDLIGALDDTVGAASTRVVAARVTNGPTPIPSGYASTNDPARYFIGCELVTADL